jgi:uncharacterized protein (DUF952 family)
MDTLYHITHSEDWTQAELEGIYQSDSLSKEGFIHCSFGEQIVGTANNFYRGQSDLILLKIDPTKVKAEIRCEDLYQMNQSFPHIYGPLNLDAVVKVVDFKPDSDGNFSLPVDVE